MGGILCSCSEHQRAIHNPDSLRFVTTQRRLNDVGQKREFKNIGYKDKDDNETEDDGYKRYFNAKPKLLASTIST